VQEINRAKFETTGAPLFAGCFLASCALAAALIGSFPLAASIVTIFLFAGVHNALEFRYFLARMPIRWGRSRNFYAAGIGGVALLTIAYHAIYYGSGNWFWSADGWQTAVALWNTAFVLWLAVLFYLRGRQKPKSDWSWAFPLAFLLAAVVWLVPAYWSLMLVYLHPFVALWFLERQIRRTKKEWLRAYRLCLLTIPVFVAILYFAFAGAPGVSQETDLFGRIARHAGSSLLPGLSSHFLVAAHVFLESVHYAVWILLMPLVDRRAIPWRVSEIPLFSGKNGFPKIGALVAAAALLALFALWAGFSVDYATTRDVYFALAMAHVLAEFPFLVKML
jgi:hypothetical protein